MTEIVNDPARRVLIFTPVGRDAHLTERIFSRANIPSQVCSSLVELCDTFEDQSAGAILLTEEALRGDGFRILAETMERQAAWSDVSILLFAGSPGADASGRVVRSLDTLRNVTLLDRPMRVAAVLSTVRAALRSRERQYQVRDLLVALHKARGEAESANRLKDEFLATLSHELRTPLNAILGWTTMLRHGQVDPARTSRVFEALDRNAQAQAQLISDVLDVSRIISGKLELRRTVVDVCEVINRALDAVRPAAATKGVELHANLDARCAVNADVDRLQQVFWNVLSNAIKFTPGGGRISVTTRRRNNDVEVAISDTGIGIDQAFLPYIFDRFRQADQTSTRTHGGLGLGLALVKHLVELHGGRVVVSSKGPDRGSTFVVTLVGADAQIDAQSSSTAASSEVPAEFDFSFTGRVILVVDDDAATREVLSAVLRPTGAEILITDSAASALQAVRERRPDVLIADLGMPEEDGFSLIRRVRASTHDLQHLPAMALSAYADAASQSAAIAAGFTTFLAKPARPQDVLRMVNDLLRPLE